MASSSAAAGSIQARTQGRLMKEQKMLNDQKQELAELGIWVHYDDNDLTKAKGMILGPQVGNFCKPRFWWKCCRRNPSRFFWRNFFECTKYGRGLYPNTTCLPGRLHQYGPYDLTNDRLTPSPQRERVTDDVIPQRERVTDDALAQRERVTDDAISHSNDPPREAFTTTSFPGTTPYTIWLLLWHPVPSSFPGHPLRVRLLFF